MTLSGHQTLTITYGVCAPPGPARVVDRWSRGKLALREDGWRLPDGTERAYPVLAVGVTVGVLGFVEPERVCSCASSVTWRARSRGSCRRRRAGRRGAEAAAQRELREEGGYRAERLVLLTRFWPSNAYLDELAWCYVAHA